MNGYDELRNIHRLAHEAIVEFDKGEFPERSLIAKIREIAGTFPKFGKDNEYIGYARFRSRGDNQEAYLSLCDSDDECAFKIYKRPSFHDFDSVAVEEREACAKAAEEWHHALDPVAFSKYQGIRDKAGKAIAAKIRARGKA